MNNEWNKAIAMQGNEQQMAEDESTRQYGEQVLSEFDNLVQKGEQQRAEARRMQDATLSAMMLQAKNGNGFVPREVLDAASKNMGFPVAGGTFDQKGNFILLGMKQDADGSQKMVPVAFADHETQFRTLNRAKIGIEYQRELYDELSRKFTQSQLHNAGIVSPPAPATPPDPHGTTTLRGDTARRLGASIIHERRGISAFGANGKGGFTQYGENGQVDFGTRATGQDQWKQISVGADPNGENGEQIRRYENSKTGEVVAVRDGEVPLWERRNGAQKNGDRMDIARINAESRERIAKGKNESNERVAALREAGRESRAIMRDDQAWNKLAIEWQKVDDAFAVQMRKADTFGKRVDLIEQKLKNDYEIALKKAKTAEGRNAVEAEYKDRMASVAEGNIDLGWFKADTYGKRGSEKTPDENRARVAQIERLNKEFEAANQIADKKKREAALKKIEAERESLFETSSDSPVGGKKPYYKDMAVGQKFRDKNGQIWVRTEKGAIKVK